MKHRTFFGVFPFFPAPTFTVVEETAFAFDVPLLRRPLPPASLSPPSSRSELSSELESAGALLLSDSTSMYLRFLGRRLLKVRR